MKRYILPLIGLLLYSSLSFAQTLDDYFSIAAENNAGLQSVYKEYEAALQKAPQVSGLPDPTISIGYSIAMAKQSSGNHQTQFTLMQMFPWFGTLKAQRNAAALIAEASFQRFLDAKNKLYYQVATAFYPLYELKDWITIEEENISILTSYKTIATNKFKSGTGAMVDVLRVDIMLKDAQTNLQILKAKEKPLSTTFNKLLNRPVDEAIVISDSLTTAYLSEIAFNDTLLTHNPLLHTLDYQIAASNANVLAAQKRGLPTIGIGVEYVMVGERNNAMSPSSGNDMLMPMLSVSIPIFRKKYKASVKEAKLMTESLTLMKEEVSNTLVSTYEMARFELEQQQQLISLYEQQSRSAQQSLELLFTAYGTSGKEFEEVLRMQQELLKYRKMRATSLSNYQVAWARINYLTAKTN